MPSGVAPAPIPGDPSASGGGAAPSRSGRGGCMTTMIGFFVVLAALLGLLSQL
jgi:hypothetical protein